MVQYVVFMFVVTNFFQVLRDRWGNNLVNDTHMRNVRWKWNGNKWGETFSTSGIIFFRVALVPYTTFVYFDLFVFVATEFYIS